MNQFPSPALPLGEPARGEGGGGSHVLDHRAAQSLLGDERLAVLADQSLQNVRVGERTLAQGFHRRRKLGGVANALERGPEPMDRRLVRFLAEPDGQSGEAPELPSCDRPERHLLHTARKQRRDTQAREHEAVLGAVERLEKPPAAALAL